MKKLILLFNLLAISLFAQTSPPTVIHYLYSVTNINQILGAVSPPFVTVLTNGQFIGGGAIHTPITTTCGIQEAIDYLLVGTNNYRSHGGTIYFGPGVYYTSNTIMIPGTHYGTNMISIDFVGAGKISSGITYRGTATNCVIMVWPTNSHANFHPLQIHGPDNITFGMKNMFVSSWVNGCTNLLLLKNPAPTYPGAPEHRGAIESATIERCWFFMGDLTNTTWVQSQISGRNQDNLIGIGVDVNYTDQIIIRDCSFVSLNCGISFACDWGSIEGCIFENCPDRDFDYITITNAWPTSSPYHIGATIVFREASTCLYNPTCTDVGGSYVVNTHQWWISKNEFIGGWIPYFSYLIRDWEESRLLIYNDSLENAQIDSGVLVTTGNPITFVNPKLHGWRRGSYPPICPFLQDSHPLHTNRWGYGYITNGIHQGYVLTNFANFSYWDSTPIYSLANSNDYMRVVDHVWGTNANVFASMAQLTSVGTNKQYVATNVGGTTVVGQIPINISNITYYIDLKRP